MSIDQMVCAKIGSSALHESVAVGIVYSIPLLQLPPSTGKRFG
jgi:hypothetical protein